MVAFFKAEVLDFLIFDDFFLTSLCSESYKQKQTSLELDTEMNDYNIIIYM